MNWSDLESLMTDGISPQGRDIHLYTGQRGADMYTHNLAVSNAVDYVEWMLDKNKIEEDVAKNLISMLRSEDKDNFNIAMLAIEQLKK